MRTTTHKQAKFEARRLEVIRASARVFARLGFHRASISDLAEEMKTTPAAIYYYVDSKDDLLRLASEIAIEGLQAVLDDINSLTDVSGFERLKRYFRGYAEFTCNDFGRCLALTNAEDLAAAHIDEMLEGRRNLDRSARDLIRSGVKDGSIRPCNEKLLAAMLYGTANSMARWWSPGGPLSPSQIMDQVFEIIETGLHTDAPDGASSKGGRAAPKPRAARA